MTFKHVAPVFTLTRLEENAAYIYTGQKVGSYCQLPYDGTGWIKGNQTDLLNERTSNSAIYLEI
jgi:hypothetical protein